MAPAVRRGSRGAPSASVKRSGEYNRLAEPGWADPLDTSYSLAAGGRWNAPDAFPVLYLNDTLATARLQVLHKLRGQPYGPEDLDPDAQHDLVTVQVPRLDYLDCVSGPGLGQVRLPATYPRHRNGRPVTHATCRPIGHHAHRVGLSGVACRSAAAGAAATNEELCFFDRAGPRGPTFSARVSFADWWWS